MQHRPPRDHEVQARRAVAGRHRPGIPRHRPLAGHGPARDGREGRRSRGHPLREPAGVDDERLRDPHRVRGDGAGLPDAARMADRVHPQRRQHGGADLFGQGATRQSARDPRPRPVPQRHHRLRSAGHAAGGRSRIQGRRRARQEVRGRARPRMVRRVAQIAHARRSGHAGLHVRHDRQSEGRHAHARQHHQQHRDRARIRPVPARRCGAVDPAAVAHPGADGGLPLSLQRRLHRLRGEREQGGRQSRRSAAALLRRRAAPVREDARACSTTWPRRRPHGRRSSPGP